VEKEIQLEHLEIINKETQFEDDKLYENRHTQISRHGSEEKFVQMYGFTDKENQIIE